MDGFMQLVKDMRAAQKKYFAARSKDALLRSKALEKRVDEEIKREEGFANIHNNLSYPNCIVMADGRKLRQGNLFEDQ